MGDCGMFVIKYAEYLKHIYPFNSLIGDLMDWFWKTISIELFYMKDLPM